MKNQYYFIVLIHKILARVFLVVGVIADFIYRIFFLWIVNLFSKKRRALNILKYCKQCELDGDIAGAIDLCKKAIKIAPNFGLAYGRICHYYLKLTKFEMVEKYFKLCLKHNKNVPDIYLYMGVVHSYRGKKEEALKCLEIAEEMFPEKFKNKARVLISKIKSKI